jgi:hypothetical protein
MSLLHSHCDVPTLAELTAAELPTICFPTDSLVSYSHLFLSTLFFSLRPSCRTNIGHVHLNTSSDLKYTCVKIHFIGLVTTKVAKIEEQTYVLNQQLVLLGHANNSTEFVLEEGKYSWPFHFTIPMQHLPSSGKVIEIKNKKK